MSVDIKNAREIEGLRVASEMAAETLVLVGERIRAGMTTEDINTIVHEDTIRRGAYPAPLNYHGFPKSVCTSVNEVVCHGIPGPQVLKDGKRDIVNVDVTTMFKELLRRYVRHLLHRHPLAGGATGRRDVSKGTRARHRGGQRGGAPR